MTVETLQPLTPAQIDAYWRDGFIILEDLLDPALIGRLQASLDEIIRRARDGEPNPDVALEKNATMFSVRTVENLVKYGDDWWKLVRHPRVLGAARDLMGSEVYLHQTRAFMKPPREGSAKEWHQDLEGGFLLPEETRRCMALGPALTDRDVTLTSIQYYLDDSTETNGCLEFIVGSHKWGMVEKRQVDERMPASTVLKATAKAGSAALFHGLAAHYSSPNRSDRWRRAPIVRYFAPTPAYTWRQFPETAGFGTRLI